jgi:hypothetical protein
LSERQTLTNLRGVRLIILCLLLITKCVTLLLISKIRGETSDNKLLSLQHNTSHRVFFGTLGGARRTGLNFFFLANTTLQFVLVDLLDSGRTVMTLSKVEVIRTCTAMLSNKQRSCCNE